VSHMTREITESDWKVLRKLHSIALERFCARLIDVIHGITSASDRSAHDRYLDVLTLIKKREREMADAFDDLRRSTAFLRLLAIQCHGLLTEEELERFSPETRELLRAMLGDRPPQAST
jgi:hypothetical protein